MFLKVWTQNTAECCICQGPSRPGTDAGAPVLARPELLEHCWASPVGPDGLARHGLKRAWAEPRVQSGP